MLLKITILLIFFKYFGILFSPCNDIWIHFIFSYDFVNVHDGENDQAAELGAFEGDLAKMIAANGGSSVVTSTGNNIFIQLKSDDSINRPGFILQITRGMICICYSYLGCASMFL